MSSCPESLRIPRRPIPTVLYPDSEPVPPQGRKLRETFVCPPGPAPRPPASRARTQGTHGRRGRRSRPSVSPPGSRSIASVGSKHPAWRSEACSPRRRRYSGPGGLEPEAAAGTSGGPLPGAAASPDPRGRPRSPACPACSRPRGRGSALAGPAGGGGASLRPGNRWAPTGRCGGDGAGSGEDGRLDAPLHCMPARGSLAVPSTRLRPARLPAGVPAWPSLRVDTLR